jgi:spore coat polysaccharide biosynthesis protein SpsF (cytidylyltransferase family)
MRVVAIVQARMNSSRLPGKVLLPLAGKPVLYHIHQRLLECRLIDEIVFATSQEISDDPIADFCNDQNISLFRGNLNDVLDRYYKTAQQYRADSIVRITGDCPIIDPIIVDAVVSGFLVGQYDCYGLGGEFPDGLDCTAFSFKAIEKAWEIASLPSDREHVGPFIENNTNMFKNGSLELFSGLSDERWTLDELQDFKLLSLIFDELYTYGSIFYTQDILQLLKRKPELRKINSSIIRNEGYIKSLIAEAPYEN